MKRDGSATKEECDNCIDMIVEQYGCYHLPHENIKQLKKELFEDGIISIPLNGRLSAEQAAREFIETSMVWHAYKIYCTSRGKFNKVDVPTFINIMLDVVGVEFAIKNRRKYEQRELFP